MRQIMNDLCCQICRIADISAFNGYYADESGFYSDFSLYEDDLSEAESLKGEDTAVDRLQDADGYGAIVTKDVKRPFVISNFYVRRKQLKKALSQTDDATEGPVGSHTIPIEKREANDQINIVRQSYSFSKGGVLEDASETGWHTAKKKFSKDHGNIVTKIKKKKHMHSGEVAGVDSHDKRVTGGVDAPTLNVPFDLDPMMYKIEAKSKVKSLHSKSNQALHSDDVRGTVEDNVSRKIKNVKELHSGEPHSASKNQFGVEHGMSIGVTSSAEGVSHVLGAKDAKSLKSKEEKSKQDSYFRDEDKDIKPDSKVIWKGKMVDDDPFRTMSVKVGNSSKTKIKRDTMAGKEEYEQQKHNGSLKAKRRLVKGPLVGLKDQGEQQITNKSDTGKMPNVIQNKRHNKEGLVGSHADNQKWRMEASFPVDKYARDKTAAREVTTAGKKMSSVSRDEKGQKGSENLFEEMPCDNASYRNSFGRTEHGASNVFNSNEDVAKTKSLSSELVRSAKQEKPLDTIVSFSNAGGSLSQKAHGKDFDHKAIVGEISSVTGGVSGKKGHSMYDKSLGSDTAEHEILNTGWVSCDDCHKWRRIPSTLADVIEATNCQWRCRDNPNKDYADCSIPQEKSDAEINAELNISEVSFCKEEEDNERLADSGHHKRAVWTHIKHNVFLHRQRKIQSINEVMVCQCKPPKDGCMGCGDECLNRIISIECVHEACPCGELCANQQFQRRAYVKVGWYRCGKKGFGLQVLDDVRKGTFIIEYVGEVLDRSTYQTRKKEYARRGQKHFYFMKLNGDEVLDAYAKGNLGRFINHSCEPNCITEKWMVNGEVCIGVFASRNLAKGEEITIDYNHAQACGAPAKKCYCSSSICRGFFGGDSTAPLAITESDSDSEEPEPLMLEEPDKQEDTLFKGRRLQDEKRHVQERSAPPVSALKRRLASIGDPDSVSKRIKFTSLEKPDTGKDLFTETGRGQYAGVQERLKVLLDDNGGISKQKDSAMLYLKLLVTTAASGDSVDGEASKRIKDISMVLDAIFKTAHRSILVDIINKNGLHIFHNMLKQNKRNYQKTPIIRKVLKVLEFLAAKNILTFENIDSNAPHSGVESIRDTIMELCHHSDVEVQVFARRFRDKWLPRKLPRGHRGPISESSLKNSDKIFSQDEHRSYPPTHMVPDQAKKVQDYEIAREQSVSHTDAANINARRRTQWDQPGKMGNEKQSSGIVIANKQIESLVQSSKNSDQMAHMSKVQGTSSGENVHDNQHKGAVGLSALPPISGGFPAVSHPVTQRSLNTDSGSRPTLSSSSLPAVVSGVPVEHLLGTLPTACVPQQQGTICYGIPVTIGKENSGSQNIAANVPASSWESSPVVEPSQSQVSTSNRKIAEQQQHHKLSIEVGPLGPNKESKIISFGVPYIQFFQQMQSVFGPAFNPWHAQLLMAAHSWGPYFSVNSERFLENTEPNLDSEPPVPGLSPPHKSGSARQGSKPGRFGVPQRAEVAIQSPNVVAIQQTEVSKSRPSRWESGVDLPTEASSGQSSRWESESLASQRTETSKWRPENFHEPQDGSAELSNRKSATWEDPDGPPRKFHGQKYNRPMYRRENFPRNYGRPRQPWQSDSSRYHVPTSGAYWENVSHEDPSQRALHHSQETKWDSMSYPGNGGDPPLRSDIRCLPADNKISENQSFFVNKLNVVDGETGQSTSKKYFGERDGYCLAEESSGSKLVKNDNHANDSSASHQSRQTLN